MKQFALFTGNRFGNFFQLFKKKTPKEIKPISIEDLKNQIISLEYEEKLKALLKEDLLNNYDKLIVEEVLEDLSVSVYENPSFKELLEEEEEPETEFEQQNIEPETNYIIDCEKKNEVDKIEDRIPKWFRNPHQINTRIMVGSLYGIIGRW